MLGLDKAYLCTKFDHSSFSHSRDMVSAHQNLNGSCDLTMPPSWMVCHLRARNCRYDRLYKMSKMGWFGVVRGHSRFLEIALFNWAHTSNYVPILRRFWDIAIYWSKIATLNLPHFFLAPLLGVTPSEFLLDLWRQKTRDPGLLYGVVCVILYLSILVQYRPVTDGQTDTGWQHIPR